MEKEQNSHLEMMKNLNTAHQTELESLRASMKEEIDQTRDSMEKQREKYEAEIQDKETEIAAINAKHL